VTGRSRRRFLRGSLALAGLGLLSGCGVQLPPAQPPAKVPRIGYPEVNPVTTALVQAQTQAFREGLREFGYVEGQTIAVELRSADGRVERIPDLVVELVQLPVDLIVAVGPSQIREAKNATQTIPVVMVLGNDPVRQGFVASLARPGGNVTGLASLNPQLIGKRLQLLKETVPGLSRVAFVWNASPDRAYEVQDAELAARALGLHVQPFEARRPEDLETVFESAAMEGSEAVSLQNNPLTDNYKARIADLATRSRLPTMSPYPDFPANGGLLAYGPNQAALFRRAAYYVDRNLKGTLPADLPVEQPTRFDFVVNLATARALGLTLPQEVLIQATEIIQ
jgi:putative ABC transport system substrate-binding protein